MPCPRCGFERHDGMECPRCGIVFARWRGAGGVALATGAAADPGPRPACAGDTPHLVPDAAAPARAAIDRTGWLCFGLGALAALLLLAVPLARAALGALVTLIHEIGHAAAGWLFGYPSIPAFDFTYGGGVTLWHGRSLVVLAGLAAAAVYGVSRLRASAGPDGAVRPHPLRNAAIVLLALWALVAATPAHELVMIAMGHGAELAFATLFLFRALTGRSLQTPAERPLYALCGWFLVLHDVAFAWGLVTSPFEREMYGEAKGGGHWMDFSRLALEFFHVRLETVAGTFLALCALPPLAAVWLARRRSD